MSETGTTDDGSTEWDRHWTGISEMEAGSHDPLPEFAGRVREKMPELGNEVGRPLVMKVTVEVKAGELAEPEDAAGGPD